MNLHNEIIKRKRVETHIHDYKGPKVCTGEMKRDKLYVKIEEKFEAAAKTLQSGKPSVDGLNILYRLERR